MPQPQHENEVIHPIKIALAVYDTPNGRALLQQFGPEQRSAHMHSAVANALHRLFGDAVLTESRVRTDARGGMAGGARIDVLIPRLRTAIEIEMGTLRRLPTLLWKASLDYRVERLIVLCRGEYIVGMNGHGARAVHPRGVPRAHHEREGFDFGQRAFPRKMVELATQAELIPRGVRIVRLDEFVDPNPGRRAA